jgi:hypothetical protein
MSKPASPETPSSKPSSEPSSKPSSKPLSKPTPKPSTSQSAQTQAATKKPTGSTRKTTVAKPAKASKPAPLRSISDVRHFFHTNGAPVFFVGPTPFYLLGLDGWVGSFSYISFYDPWDGGHPRVFTPIDKPYVDFRTDEEVNNWLLTSPEVRAHIERTAPAGVRPKVAVVAYDETTEQLCAELGYDLVMPRAELRDLVSAKVRTEGPAGVAVAQPEQSETAAADQRWVAVEAVVTQRGTVTGPFMSGLTGRPELTPYVDGWCGNELHPDVLSGPLRTEATKLVQRIGDWLATEGYRGFFEADLLVDTERGEVSLGRLNPGISGATAITHVTAGAYADVPLFLFHLLEFMGVDFDLDLAELQRRWEEFASSDEWSQVLIHETAPTFERIVHAAATGQYRLDADGTWVYRCAAADWHQLQNDSEAFFLRIYGAGDYRWNGAALGVLVVKGRLGSADRPDELSPRTKQLIDSIRAQYSGTPLVPVA